MEEKVEIKYTVAPEKVKTWKKILDFFQDYEYEFAILNIESSPATADASITVELYSVDFFGDSLKQFVDILSNVSGLEFKNSGEDTIIMKVIVSGVWKAVPENE